jgi:penicillin V amidase
MLGFFDGVNEKGFAAAALYFEGYANYDLPIEDKERIASLDLLHYISGRCGSVDDLQALLENISIVGIADPVTQKAAPLH